MQDLYSLLNRDGGFTFNPRSGHTVSIGDVTGYAIAVPRTEQILGSSDTLNERNFMSAFLRAIQSVTATNRYVGAWHSAERDTYMIEQAEIYNVDRLTAIDLGHQSYQEAVLDMATGELIELEPDIDLNEVA